MFVLTMMTRSLLIAGLFAVPFVLFTDAWHVMSGCVIALLVLQGYLRERRLNVLQEDLMQHRITVAQFFITKGASSLATVSFPEGETEIDLEIADGEDSSSDGERTS